MKRVPGQVWIALALGLVVLGVDGAPARAQCKGNCLQAAEQWIQSPGWRGTNIRIGMISSLNQWYPAFCYMEDGQWIFGHVIGPARLGRYLTKDSAICGTSANETFKRVPYAVSFSCTNTNLPNAGHGGAQPPFPTIELRGFLNDGHTFTMSGGAGDDTLGSVDDATLCGGEGNDVLVGGDGAQILSGHDGNDWIWGGGGADVLYGGAGNDVMAHMEGPADTLRPETGDDCLCLDATVPFTPSSSCGTGTDKYVANTTLSSMPADCEGQGTAAWCCYQAGRHCEVFVSPWSQ